MSEPLNSLGFAKPPAATRVVVAMSGGVDSSVVAGVLAREGYDVVGVTLQLYDHGAAVKKKGACCAGADIHDAKRVAEKLGVAHYVLDYEERFRRQVIQDFADSYARGETPIPCIRCNEKVKFGDLLTLAKELGADALATGHYVRRVRGEGGPELHRAADDARDQSYFLFATTAAQLEMVRFPLGDMPKAKVREMAHALGQWPRSPIPRTSVLCLRDAMAMWWRGFAPMRMRRARSWIFRDTCSARMRASSISRSASAKAWDFRAMGNPCSFSNWMRERAASWWAPANRSVHGL